MLPNIGSERATVQNPLIQYAVEAGWEHVSQANALSLRKGEGGLLFNLTLEQKLVELNPGFLNTGNVNEVTRRIEAVSNNVEGNAEILAWLKGEKSIYDHNEKRERNVTFINFSDISKNNFQVTDEWQYTNGQETNRADIMFLINGIPVAIVETKSACKARSIEGGLTQIREYHHETPEMLTMPQVFDITNLINFYYGVTWNLSRKNLFKWKHKDTACRAPRFEQMVKSFFDHNRFLKMLKEWILFYVKDDELQKTILRQHQSRAVDQIVSRCEDTTKKTGLIWHTQGSGKTFTMISAARQLLEKKDEFGKPTVILMIDRNELEGQLSGWVYRILGELQSLEIKIEHANSKKKLQNLLKSDFRGLIVSMIHKFEGIPKNINTRDNIFVFMDEAHRSVGGDLGNYLVAALPNATLIGFTGTPIDKTAYGKGTFKIFGKEDDKGYLDKYSIAESIEDKTTVPLKYTLAPNEIRVEPELLEKDFLDLVQAEGVSDVEELNRILDDAVNLKTFLKSKDRIKKVAQFVAKHYQGNVEPLGYKAFLVAVDREACALYKEALDEILPQEYSLPVYTPAQHDSEKYPMVYKHQLSNGEEKRVRKLFSKQETLPKIFIVTDKLLTGFDAPILYCMYLDKPMRDHVLLQAIARVNRPYEHEENIKKPCGLVVDFVGIFEKLEKALAFDSDVVSGVIENIELALAQFKDIMSSQARDCLNLCCGPIDDKTVEKAIDAFADKAKRESFCEIFKQLEILYEILSPSQDISDYIHDYKKLAHLYQIVRSAYQKSTIPYGDIAKKTAKLVREHAEAYGLEGTMKAVKIDENTLKAIKQSGTSDNNKIINLVNNVRKTVTEDGHEAPYLKAMGERAEAILEAYDDRQYSTQEALQQIEQLVDDMMEAQKQHKESGSDRNSFSIFWTLKQEKIENAQELADSINSVFKRFANFDGNVEEMRQLKAEIYRLLLPVISKKAMITVVEKILALDRK